MFWGRGKLFLFKESHFLIILKIILKGKSDTQCRGSIYWSNTFLLMLFIAIKLVKFIHNVLHCLHQIIAFLLIVIFFLLSLAFSKGFWPNHWLGMSKELDLGMWVWIALHDGIHARHEIGLTSSWACLSNSRSWDQNEHIVKYLLRRLEIFL